MTTSQKTPTETIDAKAGYDGFSLTLERYFGHAPERVFDAWTSAEALTHWMGPEGVVCTSIQADARPGGTYRFEMRGPDGGEHTALGTYLTVDRPSKLVFTWAWEVCGDDPPGTGTRISLDFRADGDGTTIQLLQEGLISEDIRDHHDAGWTGSFTCLDAYLSGSV